jgi:hypothetical protein
MTQNFEIDPADPRSVIEAFADSEPVDPDDLTRALASPEGREHLVDLLVLRKLVRGPHAPIVRDARPAAGVGAVPRRWWAIAATVVLLAGAGGDLGGARAARTSAGDRASVPPQALARTQPASPQPPPQPTETIRLERGVDWAERFGGY